MAERTVKVKLILDKSDYQSGLKGAATDTRAFDAEVKTLGDHAVKTGTEVKSTGADIESTGAKMRTAATDAKSLEQRIAETRTAMRDLAAEFERTGNTDIFKQFRQQSSQLGILNRLKKELDGAKAEIEKFAKGTGGGGGLLNFALDEWIANLARSTKQGIQSGLDSLSGTAPTGLMQWLVAGGVAAAPAILAAIDGAILTGVGSVGIGAAIIGQIKDPAVSGAFKDLGTEVMQYLTAASVSFRDPLIRASQEFRGVWQSILPGLTSSFEALAPAISSLADGFAGLVTRLMPGFNDALRSSAPILEMIGSELPHIGDALSVFFQSIAAGGEGGKKALQDLLIITEGMIISLGKLIEVGSKAFNWLDKAKQLGPLVPLLDHLAGSTDKTKTAFNNLKDGADAAQGPLGGLASVTGTLAGNFRDAVTQAGYFSKALDNLNGGNINLIQSQITANSAVDKFKQALKDSHGQLDLSTEKGRAAYQAALDLAKGAGDVAQKTYEQSGSSQQGAKALDYYRTALENAFIQAGHTKDEAKLLADQLLKTPNADPQVTLHGVQPTKADMAEISRELNNLDGQTANTYIVTHYRSDGTPSKGFARYPGEAYGGIIGAADGMIATSAPTIVFGERTLPEAYVPAPNSGISQQRADSLLGTAASWWGRDIVPRSGASTGSFNLNLTVSTAPGLSSADNAMTTMFLGLIRTGKIRLSVDQGGRVKAS